MGEGVGWAKRRGKWLAPIGVGIAIVATGLWHERMRAAWEAWHYTAGWGNLFTITIALAALVISSRHNGRTFRTSVAQFERVRRETLNDRLRSEIIGLATILTESGDHGPTVVRRIIELVKTPDYSARSSTERDHLVKAIVLEEIADTYRRIGQHIAVIAVLSIDDKLLEIIAELTTLVAAERGLFEALQVSRPDWTPEQQNEEQLPKAARIDEIRKMLLYYCHEKLRPADPLNP